MKKRLVALLLAFSLSVCMCVSAFAADTGIDIIDDPLSYYFQNQLLGVQKGTGVTLVCPNGDYKTLYTGGTLVTCPYDGEALELASEGGVTAKKAPSGVGRKDILGYADDNGKPSINKTGMQAITLKPVFRYRTRTGNPLVESGEFSGLTFDGKEDAKSSYSVQVSANRLDVKNTSDSSIYMGRFYVSYEYTFPDYGTVYFDTDDITWKVYGAAQITDGEFSDVKSWGNSFVYVDSTDKTYGYRSVEPNSYKFWKAFTVWDSSSWNLSAGRTGRAVFSDVIVYFKAAESPIINKTNITINNNKWNGNIYVDDSTNLTYIYPQYTVINEAGDTVTNISENPIIYNNETKQYYTYDTVTNNYYYITYGDTPATPTPSPSPTPDPDNPDVTPTPTPTPGGDTGDTTGILAVLVEIRDNMIQGFLDIKAAFVAGFAELSANFTLAIENLNVNIQNIFNKKFPDQSTPETALPSPTPSPSPAPLDPILPETQNLIIPKMNSNTFTDEHGTWIASGSSKYSDVFDFFHAFDRSTSDFWETNAKPSYLQIEIPDPESYYIDGYIMRVSKFNNRYAKEWTLQGSDDGNTWDDLDKQTGQNLSDLEEHKYPLTLRKAYKYYRLNMSNYASSMCSLSHFNLLGYDAKDVVTPTPSPGTPDVTPTPVPTDKPDGGNTTNNFWNIIFPNFSDDGTDSGHKGIFWALVSLILAIIAFFTNMLAGYKYLFPFLPDGVVMTINACVFVLFLFVVIKFIMRSK